MIRIVYFKKTIIYTFFSFPKQKLLLISNSD